MPKTLALIFLLSGGVAYAQEASQDTAKEVTQELKDEASEASPPDPAALAADWWKYFGEAGEKLTERIAAFKARLSDEAVSAADFEDASTVVDEIRQSLDIYADFKGREPASPAEVPQAEESYALADLLELVSRIRDTQLELDLEREDIEHREAATKRARQRLDDLLAAYLSLDKQAATRTQQGLLIIRDRLRLELAGEELRLLKPQFQEKERQLKELQDLQATAATRLVAQPADVETYKTAYQLAETELSRLNEEAAFYRLRRPGVAETPKDHAETRRFQQRLIDFDVRIAAVELARAHASVAVALTSHISAGAAGGDQVDLGTALAALETQLKEVDKLRNAWRRATDAERNSAEAQLALTQGQDAGLATIHRGRIDQAEQTLGHLATLRERLAQGQMLAELAAHRLAQEQGQVAKWWADFQRSLSNVWGVIAGRATGSLFTINETPVTLLGLFRILVILAIAWWLSKLVRHALERFGQRNEAMNRAALYTTGRLFHYVILTIGIFIGLSSIGLDFTKLALFVSALGVGLGFGLQAIFSNFVAGLIILFERSLKVGDFVELESGVHGEVREINIRSTLITTNDNIDILVPNSEFVSGRVINWTLREAHRRLRIPFGVAYGTDKELVKKAALEAAAAVPYTLTSPARRRPQVWLVEFGDSSLNFELVVWLTPEAVSRPATVHAAYTWEIETALKKYGIEIPFPQRDLHLRSGFKELLTEPADQSTPAPAVNPALRETSS